MPYLTYKASKYSVPQNCAYSTVKYMVSGGKIHIFDENRKFICSHNLSEVRGSFNQLPEHRKAEGGSYIEVMEKLGTALKLRNACEKNGTVTISSTSLTA